MAVTENTYTGDGSTVLFSFTFPYLDQSHVKVSLNGSDTTAFTFANATTVQLNSAPAVGVAVRVYRNSDADNVEATFFPGSAIRATDLNENFLQSLYLNQETRRIAQEATLGGIADGSIGTAKLATGAVTDVKIGSGAVTEAKIGTGAVTETKLGAGAVTNSKIAAGAVDATQLATDAVTNAKIATGAVNTDELASSAVTTDKIANSAVSTDKIASSAVTQDKIGTNVLTPRVSEINGGPLAGFRNAIINGNFDVWQRGTSSSAGGYQTADRWRSTRTNSTLAVSQQPFTLGQTAVPGEPTYYISSVVTSAAGAGNFASIQQKIESVRTFAGQEVTVSFWAKADATKPMAVELLQYFGTGGTPSSELTASAVKVTLTTSWQKFTLTATLPSISGKTLGSDNNDAVWLTFWFDAGSNFNSQTDSLGQQSGTFDIAQVQVEAGAVATPFERRPIGTELALCQRYYYQPTDSVKTLFKHAQMGATGRSLVGPMHSLPVEMRVAPTINYTDENGTANRWTVGTANNVTPSAGAIAVTRTMIRADLNFGAISQDYTTAVTRNLTADAEL